MDMSWPSRRKIWQEHGALEFRECAGDDLNVEDGDTFPRTVEA
jgi:uncharacterized protein YbaA (DUF1428 family)